MQMDAITLGILLNTVSTVLLLVTALIMLIQTWEMRRATHASAFKAIYDILQADDVRAARRVVLTTLKAKPINDWSEEEVKAAEKVGHTYDSVSIMIRNHMVPVQIIADSWGDSLRRTWQVLSPLVDRYRKERNSLEFWDDFEWLASKADSYKKPSDSDH